MAAHLAAHRRAPLDALPGQRRAAVAIVVVDGGDEPPRFVLTRRAARMKEHAGQWALPGGRVDDGEDASGAARRETWEEVGLRLDPHDAVGTLDDYAARSGFVITPVVFWIDREHTFEVNPAEVAELHLIGLDELDRPDSPRFVTMPESERLVIQMHLGEYRIHAPTAAVLFQFREVAVHGRPTRVAHYDQPVWAWR